MRELQWTPANCPPIHFPSSQSLPNNCAAGPSLLAVDQCGLTHYETQCVAAGHAFAGMRTGDPRLNLNGALVVCLTSLYQAWAKEDDLPSRVEPLPLKLLTHVVALAHHNKNTAESLTAAVVPDVWVLFPLSAPAWQILVWSPEEVTDNLCSLRDLTHWIGWHAPDHSLQHFASNATLMLTGRWCPAWR